MHKTVLAPVLYGEGETQILIVNDLSLPEPALKIWDVKLLIKDLTAQVCKGKVIVQGILHKQIVFVNKKTNLLQHHQADVPFSDFIEIPCAEPGMDLSFSKAKVQEDCGGEELTKCPAPKCKNDCEDKTHFGTVHEITCLHEKHIVDICVNVFRTEKICINDQCPPFNYEKGDKCHDIRPTMQTGFCEWHPHNPKSQT